MLFLYPDKPPTDPKERKWYFKQKMMYVRYHRFYGNTLVGGVDRAKIITVTENGSKKKKGKNKDGKIVRCIVSTILCLKLALTLHLINWLLLRKIYFFAGKKGETNY